YIPAPYKCLAFLGKDVADHYGGGRVHLVLVCKRLGLSHQLGHLHEAELLVGYAERGDSRVDLGNRRILALFGKGEEGMAELEVLRLFVYQEGEVIRDEIHGFRMDRFIDEEDFGFLFKSRECRFNGRFDHHAYRTEPVREDVYLDLAPLFPKVCLHLAGSSFFRIGDAVETCKKTGCTGNSKQQKP